jgi:hypothetical protein
MGALGFFTESNVLKQPVGRRAGGRSDTDGSRPGGREKPPASSLRWPLVEEGDADHGPRAEAHRRWARGHGCRSRSRAGAGGGVRHGERRARGHAVGTGPLLAGQWRGGKPASSGGSYVGSRWPSRGYAAVATRWA